MGPIAHDWEWLGDPLGLDFANTVRRRGMRYEELWRSPEDLREWARRQRGRVPVPGRGPATDRLAEVQALRDHALAVLRAAAAGERLPSAATARLNAAARERPVVRQLGIDAGERHASLARFAAPASPVDELLARCVAATIEIAAHPRLTLCDSPGCGQLFLRERENKRWCGPACGTRARVARHAARGRHPRA
jgi:predicted RNA-binding Zn ribbon-like protein